MLQRTMMAAVRDTNLARDNIFTSAYEAHQIYLQTLQLVFSESDSLWHVEAHDDGGYQRQRRG
jgi:hypothetical protein